MQAYYWSLTPPRQEAFWRISDNDKLALTAMDEDRRTAAWEMVEQRLLNSDPPAGSAPIDEAQDTPGETPPLPDNSP